MIYKLERKEDPHTYDFLDYQAIIALRGDWSRLSERASSMLTAVPAKRGMNEYQIDHRFYLALARGDESGMEQALSELPSPSAVYRRENDDSGYVANLISTAVVLYAKTAWYHGFETKVNTSYIPAESPPVAPLDAYPKPYPFLRNPLPWGVITLPLPSGAEPGSPCGPFPYTADCRVTAR